MLADVFVFGALQVWDFVRKAYPVLSEKTNEELIEAMEPIKAVPVDIRNL